MARNNAEVKPEANEPMLTSAALSACNFVANFKAALEKHS